MHFNFKTYLIILVLVGGFLIYRYAVPYVRHTILHFETKTLYNNFTDSRIPWQVFGQSENNKPIYVLEAGQGDHTTIIFGAFHGDEQTGFHLVTQLAETLYTDPGQIRGKVVLVPVVNPDGLLKRRRTNANGVDINRNFPTENWSPAYKGDRYYPGIGPASEKETIHVINMLDKYQPDKIISIHDDLRMNNYNGPARGLADLIGGYNGYPVTGDVGYPTPGSFGTFGGTEMNIPLITLELPDIGPEDGWEQNARALIEAINYDVTP